MIFGRWQTGVVVERRSRRTALVLTTIAVMMVVCAKLTISGAVQRSDGAAVGVHTGFRFVLDEDEAAEAPAPAEAPAEEAPASDAPADGDAAAAEPPAENKEGEDGRSGEEEGGSVTPFNPATVGWDKSVWTGTDWATWIVPGPIVTVVLSGFIFYMYGPMWAAGTFVVMMGVDALAFYTNA